MRTHAEIIEAAGGPHALAAKLGDALSVEAKTLESRVRGWNLKPASIPGEYWPLMASLGLSTVEELAAAAAERRGIPTAPPVGDEASV